MTKSTDPRTALDGYLSEYEILKGKRSSKHRRPDSV